MRRELIKGMIGRWRDLPSDTLVPSKIAAVILGVDEVLLDKKRSLGRGVNYVKIGGSVRYKKSDIDEELRKSEYNRTQEGKC